MAKYPISKEFFPFNLFAPPMSKKFVLMAQKYMKTPGLLWKDPELDVQTRTIPGYQGGEIEVYILAADDHSRMSQINRRPDTKKSPGGSLLRGFKTQSPTVILYCSQNQLSM
jgi:hypothetical protein